MSFCTGHLWTNPSKDFYITKLFINLYTEKGTSQVQSLNTNVTGFQNTRGSCKAVAPHDVILEKSLQNCAK